MAKAASAPRPTRRHPSENRYGQKTVAELRGAVDELRDQAAALRALAETAEKIGAASLRIDGATKFDRGVKLIREFRKKVEIALIKLQD